MTASAQSTQELASVCPLDCPDTCSLSVTVSDGQIERISGSHANPFTAGVVCAKVVKNYPEFVHGDNRIKYPMQRVGARGSGEFRRISWSEAIQNVCDGLQRVVREWGPQAVVPFNYAGPHGVLAGASMDRRFFHRLGASLLDRGPLCGGIRGLAYGSQFGAVPGMPPEQAAQADLVVVWGNNVTVSNLHLARSIQVARRRGAKLVVIDPKRIRIAEQADLHLPLLPGTDVILAFAVAAELRRLGALDQEFVDRNVSGADAYLAHAAEYSLADAARICGLNEADIQRFAELYAGAGNVAVSPGNGFERNRNGGSGVRAALALQVLTGQFGRPGAGVICKASQAFPSTSSRLERADLVPTATRCLNILDIPQHILDHKLNPPVKALVIYNHNPVAVHPDQNAMRKALMREDVFLVGVDVAMTDSMDYCDIVLPAATHFEHADVFAAYGQHWLQRAEPVIAPQGEALPNTEIFRRLGLAFGFEESIFGLTDAQLMDQAFDADDARLSGKRASEIPVDSAVPMRFDGREASLFENVFPKTVSGKIELYSQDLQDRYGQGLPSYQVLDRADDLVLVTPSSDLRTNATFGGLAASDGLQPLEMHPHDARVRNLEDATSVRVSNSTGEVILRLVVTAAVRPGVVYSPKGAWLRTSPTGQTTNALMPTHKSDIADGACFNDALVQVSKA